jgi:hypothetical protein
MKKDVMDYNAQLVSSNSSYNYVTRQLIATPQPEVDLAGAPSAKAEKRPGQSVLSIVLFIAIFFGILTAFGVGLSSLGSSSNISQTVSEYVRRLS